MSVSCATRCLSHLLIRYTTTKYITDFKRVSVRTIPIVAGTLASDIYIPEVARIRGIRLCSRERHHLNWSFGVRASAKSYRIEAVISIIVAGDIGR